MKIERLKLTNFRNYDNLSIDLSDKINIFIGNNAQGKTNILESIYYLSITKSYRTLEENNLIKFDKDFSKIEASCNNGKFKYSIMIDIIRNKGKKITLNCNPVKKISSFIGTLNAVLMAPEEVEIIKGSPLVRRNLLNVELSKLNNEYIDIYNEYHKILKMRNDYLKILYTNGNADDRYLDILTNNLIERAIYIYKKRNDFISSINNHLESIFYDITGIHNLSINYVTNIDNSEFGSENIKNSMLNKFNKNKDREIFQGMTLYGPHRDDLEFLIDDKPLKLFGSEGQQKLAIISYKLSLIEIFRDDNKEIPILLLDDIFSELDKNKKNKLISYINNIEQVIITTNDIRDINKKKLLNTKVFKIKNNSIEEKGDNNGNGK